MVDQAKQLPQNAKKVFSGIVFDVYQWEQELYDGTVTTFERAKRADTVTILAVTNTGSILILEQEQPMHDPFISLPGGVVDNGEAVTSAALRELQEEAGYTTEELEFQFSYNPGGRLIWQDHIFIARNCEQLGKQQLDGGEKIKVREVGFHEFVQIMINPAFRNVDVALPLLREYYKVGNWQWLWEKLGIH